MINRIESLPAINEPCAELIKIQNLLEAYRDTAQLFYGSDTEAIVLLLDSNAIIYGDGKNEELKEFLRFAHPISAFSSSENLDYLFGRHNTVNVLICDRPPKIASGGFENTLSSRDMYDILSVDEFDLPPYEYFAADYCRRLNRGLIKVFAKKDVCAAFTLESEKYRLLGGIASRQRGIGSALLLAAIAGDKPVLCVAEDALIPFYTKFGFTLLYKAGYWRK